MANLFKTGAVDDAWHAYWTAGDITMLAVNDTYDPDNVETDLWLSDIDDGARIGEVVLPTPTEADAVFSAGDCVIPSASGQNLIGYWIYKDTGTETTSRLILWIDHNADGTPVSGPTDDAGISIPFSPSGIFTVATVPL